MHTAILQVLHTSCTVFLWFRIAEKLWYNTYSNADYFRRLVFWPVTFLEGYVSRLGITIILGELHRMKLGRPLRIFRVKNENAKTVLVLLPIAQSVTQTVSTIDNRAASFFQPMKVLALELKTFVQSHFNIQVNAALSLFIAVLIAFNYSIDFEDSYIESSRVGNVRWLLFFLTNSLGYYGTLFITLGVSGQLEKMRNIRFILISALGILIFSVHRSINIVDILRPHLDMYDFRFVCSIMSNFYSIFTLILPLFFVYRYIQRDSAYGSYGLRVNNVDFKPYLIMVAFMIPVIYMASFSDGFSTYYPVARRVGADTFAYAHDIPVFVAKGIFEVFYLTDFLSIELIFRGFFVIGLARYLGKDVILPMVTIYAMCHFGKPLGETISSVFGGYILGILAYQTKNIWGGVFAHTSVALLMEVFAFIQM